MILQNNERLENNYTTTLIVKEWEKLKFSDKLRLITHEFAIAADYENDGEYFISSDFIKILQAKSKYFFYRSRAKIVQENPDGTVFFNGPHYYVDLESDQVTLIDGYSSESIPITREHRIAYEYTNMSSDVNGVCKFLGLSEAIGYETYTSGAAASTLASINSNGHVTKTKIAAVYNTQGIGAKIIDSITCK